jgi:hypothetical protein
MRRLRSFFAQSPALGVAVAALILSVSGGTYATSIAGAQARVHAAVSPAATTISFHSLHLINGWQGKQRPGYAISGGVVYLRGFLHGGGSALFAVLPRAARPAHVLAIPVVNDHSVDGELDILTDGRMSVSNFSANAAVFTSLDGVSYPRTS